MTKKLRSIIITVCVGVVALAAYFVVDYIIRNSDTEGNKTATAITQFSASDIASVKVELQNGEYYYVTEDTEASAASGSTEYKVTFNGIYEGLAFNANAARLMMSYACALNAQRDLGSVDKSEYSLYGVDNPLSTVTLTKLNGETFKIYVGSATNVNAAYYCMVDGSDHIYIIASSMGEMFIRKPNEMRISQFNVPFEKLEDVMEFTYKHKGNEPIFIYRDLEASVFNPFTKYYISSPWNKKMPIDADVFPTVMNKLDVLYIREYITPKVDGSEVNLADYGLDDPWGYYKITLSNGTVQEFSFGDYVDKESEYYCYMLDHSTNDIYTVARSRVSFIEDYDALSVTSPYIISAKLDDIQYLKAEFDGKTKLLEHVRKYDPEEDKTKGSYIFNGMSTYDETALASLYMNAIGIRIQAKYDNYEHEKDAILKLTFTPFDVDEEAQTVEFYKINDNFCAAYLNGNCDFVVSMKSINAFIDAVSIVEEGGIPSYTV